MAVPTDEPLPFTCPECGSRLAPDDDVLHCATCDRAIHLVDGIPQFPLPGGNSANEGVFDRLATAYESPLWFRPMYRLLVGLRGPADDRIALLQGIDLQGEAVLDVACGTGRIGRALATDARVVYGIDRSQGMLRAATGSAERAGMDNLAFARMDATELYVADEAVDGVTCGWALHLFPDVRAALEEIHRALVPGGWFAATTVRDAWIAALPGVPTLLRRTVGARPIHGDAMCDLLEVAGFERIQLDRYGAGLFVRARK